MTRNFSEGNRAANSVQAQQDAAAAEGRLAAAREYARRTGQWPTGWTVDGNEEVQCDDQWLEGCSWRGTRNELQLIDDAPCCPRCGSLL